MEKPESENSRITVENAPTVCAESENTSPVKTMGYGGFMPVPDGPSRQSTAPTLVESSTLNRGRYRILEEMGKGGIGRVLLALDDRVGREVALKELLTGTSKGSTPSQSVNSRFLREAQVTGQLEHPSIIPVYEINETPEGTLFYTMRRIRGKTLEEVLRSATTLKERLLLLPHFRDCCNAIAYAHARGVIHRDLKPGNIMIGEFGETIVLDWGLAKVLGERDSEASRLEGNLEQLRQVDSEKTVAGATMGTPVYMPPEQALGKIDEIDQLSDEYSLGVVLFEIITGKKPYKGANAFDVLLKVVSDPIPSVRELEPGVPRELEAILTKATQKDRESRYQTVRELVSDVEKYMSGDRIAAYDYSSFELLRRFVRRNRTLVVATGVVLLALVATLLFTLWSYRGEMRARKKESMARHSAERARMRAQRSREEALRALGREQKEKSRAQLHYAQALQEKAHRYVSEKKYFSAALLSAWSMYQNPAAPTSPLFDKDFQRGNKTARKILALNRGDLLISRALKRGDRRLWFHMAKADKPRKNAHLFSLHLDAGGKHMAFCGGRSQVDVVAIATGKTLFTLKGHKKFPLWAEFDPRGRWIATAGFEGIVRLYSAKTGALQSSFKAHDSPVTQVVVDPRGEHLATCSTTGEVRLWLASTGKMEKALPGHQALVTAALYLNRGNTLATADIRGNLELWDVKSGTSLHHIAAHSQAIIRMRQDPEGKLLATVNQLGNSIRIWNIEEGTPFTELSRADFRPVSVDFSPNGRELAVGLEDRTIEVWDR
ncbi:serine/threonine protein kinase, partial [Myxococcota bacterium]|nr:serine/threonine protein kinase [Myxococcota bacterium]